MPKPHARSVALKTLLKVEKSRAFPDLILRHDLGLSGLDERDARLATELTYGVIRHRLRLDFVIDTFLREKKKLDTRVRCILRIALYQILFLDRIPQSAAVNEAVKAAGWAKSLVNGLLRRALREMDSVKWPDPETDLAGHLSLEYSHPVWLVERWLGELGAEETARLLAANNQVAPLTLRANTLKTSQGELVRLLGDAGFAARPGRFAPDAVIVESPGRSPGELPGFEEGLFQVQDEGSQAVGLLGAPGKGARVLDCCAGLGTKALHLAQLMEETGSVDALDLYAWKLEALKKDAARLSIGTAATITSDLLEFTPQAGYDLVLLDAPCTGLGTLRRNPDIKWRVHRKDPRRLAGVQMELLASAAAQTRPGGALVYAVCTITHEETAGVIEPFLEGNSGFSLEPASGVLPSAAKELADERGFLRAMPQRHHTDGFFAARLVRK